MDRNDVISFLIVPLIVGTVWGFIASRFTTLPPEGTGAIGFLLGVVSCIVTSETLDACR